MPTINGKVCVVNGTPVDKVFSNGRQVYGRNLYTDTNGFNNPAAWFTSGGDPSNFWKKLQIPITD